MTNNDCQNNAILFLIRSLKHTAKMKTYTAALSLFAGICYGHGNITSPPARQAGAAMTAICGQTAVANVNSDPTIPIEDLGTVNAGCE